MIDTNVLLSALVFRSGKISFLLEKVAEEHTMVLCSHVIDEFRSVVTKKSPKYNHVVDNLFAKLSYEMAYTPKWQKFMPDIRDEKDKPILASAILADVDILITGDKDFYDIEIERPEILSPANFLEKY
jgi:putative PIN family toxin of toxin-antitoxin system